MKEIHYFQNFNLLIIFYYNYFFNSLLRIASKEIVISSYNKLIFLKFSFRLKLKYMNDDFL